EDDDPDERPVRDRLRLARRRAGASCRGAAAREHNEERQDEGGDQDSTRSTASRAGRSRVDAPRVAISPADPGPSPAAPGPRYVASAAAATARTPHVIGSSKKPA